MIYIGADHRGFELKQKIIEWLTDKGIIIRDLGSDKQDTDDDYVDFAIKVGEKVRDEGGKGILICASGIGMSIAANRVRGVRAGLCTCPKQARLAVEEDNINVLCLSGDLVGEEENFEIIKTFINSQFMAEERFIRRINKIKKYETTNGR